MALRAKYDSGDYTQLELAEEYSIKREVVGRVVKRKSFNYSTKELKQLLKVREAYEAGTSIRDLATAHKMTEAKIYKIVKHKTLL